MAPADAASEALEGVLARFATLVRGVGRQKGLQDHEVDELIQAVRLRLWSARGSPEQIAGSPASYIYQTARTAALDLIRARRAREEPIDTMPEAEHGTLGSVDAPGRAVESGELAAQVAAAIEAVTPSRRPVLRMYLAGYPREEIAELMGWTEAKTRNLLYRGLNDLRAILADRGVGPGGTA